MMLRLEHFRLDSRRSDFTTLWIDVAERPLNVLHEQVFNELQAVLESLGRSRPQSPVVLRSAKAKGFVVGADLRRVAQLNNENELKKFLLHGQQALGFIEQTWLPTVAVIQGACLGGGLELALACRFRIADTATHTQLGMPEPKLGLMPGWGGTQRLPERVGLANALPMLLSGDSIDARRALEIGLVDAVVEPASLNELLSAFVANLSERSEKDHLTREQPDDLENLLRSIAPSQREKMSAAQRAIVQAVRVGFKESREAGFRAERELFFPLLASTEVQLALQRFAPHD